MKMAYPLLNKQSSLLLISSLEKNIPPLVAKTTVQNSNSWPRTIYLTKGWLRLQFQSYLEIVVGISWELVDKPNDLRYWTLHISFPCPWLTQFTRTGMAYLGLHRLTDTQSGVKHETQLLLQSELNLKLWLKTTTEEKAIPYQSLTWKAFIAKILPILRKDHLLVN